MMEQLSVRSLTNLIQYEPVNDRSQPRYILTNKTKLRTQDQERHAQKRTTRVVHRKRSSDPSGFSSMNKAEQVARRSSLSCCNSQSHEGKALRTTKSQCTLNDQKCTKTHDWLNDHVDNWWKCVGIAQYLPTWQPLEGSLSKYTNVMKGWQPRWFVLDPISGLLHYFEKEEQKRQKPRGSVDLAAASVFPSDEDGLMFSLNAANGDIYKLRALDARERQHWVNRLRATAEHHTSVLPIPAIAQRDRSQSGSDPVLNNGVNHGTPSRKPPENTQHHTPVKSSARFSSMRRGGSPHQSPSITRKLLRTHKQMFTRSKSTPGQTTTNAQAMTSQLQVTNPNAQVSESFKHVSELLDHVSTSHSTMIQHIQNLPNNNSSYNYLDKDFLLLKATSSATLTCLEESLAILQQQARSISLSGSARSSTEAMEVINPIQQHSMSKLLEATSPISPSENFVSAAETTDTSEENQNFTMSSNTSAPVINATPLQNGSSMSSDEVEDCDDNAEQAEVEGLDEQKSIILHLLSQLKLGMDLTKVVLPTFILERRSLLEMFADFMAHPDMFIKITDCLDPESRMLAMVEWYLTSFHAGRNGAVAKKPYNPIIGETFHCSWHGTIQQNNNTTDNAPVTPTNQTTDNTFTESTSSILTETTCDNSIPECLPEPADSSPDSPSPSFESIPSDETPPAGHTPTPPDDAPDQSTEEQKYSLRYCAEQVSHHPPVSAFYVECPEKKMFLNGSIWTKSKFMGMSVGVMMIGKISLNLLAHDEEYIFSLPSAYARSILTVPWVELGDKISITCPQSGLSANVTFHTKPFYGGKLHRTTAEVKNPSGDVINRVSGEWNGSLEFTYDNKQSEDKVIDTSKLKIMHKCVRPIDKQDKFESRRLWKDVTNSLSRGNVHEATEHKHALEEVQRQGEKHRRETNSKFPTKYFTQLEGEHVWVYKNPLQSPEQNAEQNSEQNLVNL